MWWWNVQGWWSFGAQALAALVTLAIFAFGLAAVYFVVQFLRMRNRTPKDILAERFASGEIDEMEYRRRLRVLEETAEDEERQTASV